MSTRVHRESPVQPMVAPEPPQGSTVKGKAAPPKAAAAAADVNQVEAYDPRANDANAGVVGRTLEQGLHKTLGALPDGSRMQMQISAEGEVMGVDLKAKGAVSVERQGNQYLVTVDTSAGAGAGLHLTGGAKASVTGQLEGKVTVRYRSLDEAADNLAALVQVAPAAGRLGGPLGMVVAGAAELVRDKDAVPRAIHARDRVDSIELSSKVVGDLKLKMPLSKFELGANVSVTPLSVKLDLRKGQLVFSTSTEAEAEVEGAVSVNGDARMSREVALKAIYPLTKDEVARILKDPTVIQQLADPERHIEWEAEATVRGRVGDVEIEAQRRGPPEEVLEAARKGGLLALGDGWHVEGFHSTSAWAKDLDAGKASVDVEAGMRIKVFEGQGRLWPMMKDAVSASREHAKQQQDQHVLRLQQWFLR
ncbi:MAG TPA: hypothetical protein VND93_02045 [Myxococcales bacterium]|nr:hypothetical protein [Myxococcales bacterium]